jgi:hypothetical protein
MACLKKSNLVFGLISDFFFPEDLKESGESNQLKLFLSLLQLCTDYGMDFCRSISN